MSPLKDLPPGTPVRVDADVPIAGFGADGSLYALDDTCTHQDASLSEGYLGDCSIERPLPASAFDLRTGKSSGPPARTPVRTHGVEVRDGMVCVLASGAPAKVAP